MLLRAAKEGSATHVVSVNWSSTLLRAALASPAEPRPPPESRQQEAAGSGGVAVRDSQGADGAGPGSSQQSTEALIQQQLGPEAGLSEEDKEAPVPETAAAYQVLVNCIATSQHVLTTLFLISSISASM